MVRRIFICSSQDVKKMKSGIRLPVNYWIEELIESLLPDFILFIFWFEQIKIFFTMLQNSLQNNDRYTNQHDE
jgi:hypothetical protein